MKKQVYTVVFTFLLMVGMAGASEAQSVGDYQTEAHNLRFGIGEKVDFFDTYTIQIWNKPKEAGNGNPDMVFVNGKTDEGLAGDGMCSREIYTFPQTHSEATLEIFHSDGECQVEEHPVNAVGELIVGEGTAKGRWWIYPK